MTLEDFFTLSEMKNGLATLARVEELISTMQQQKNCATTNVGDAVRQWSTVASTLTATESKDCLDLFVKLNGLHFLNQWLEETLKYSNDIADSTVEDSIHALLGSLEKLSVDREHSIASGIHTTIEKLLGFKGAEERARILYERWKQTAVNDVSYQSTVKSDACADVEPKCSTDVEAVDSANSTCLDFDNTTCRERTSGGNCRTESNVDNAADRTIPSLSSITADATTYFLPSSSYQENVSRTEESSVGPAAEITSSGTCNSSDATGSHVDDKACDASTVNDDGTAKETKMDVDTKEDSSQVLPSSSFSAASPVQKPERSISCNFDPKENTETLLRQELHGNGSKPEKEDTIETSFEEKEAVESDSEADPVVSRIDTSYLHDSPKMGKIDQTSELGLEDGELDALEVARQVAIEVEREVVDYREPFCSSSPEGSSGEVVLAQKSLLIAEKSKEDQPDGPTPLNDDNPKISETDSETDACQDETPEQKDDAHESIGKSDRERFDFDLNEDVCNEEDDYTVNHVPNVFAPIVVAASKVVPLLPVAPICFEGGHGWKGSAATSAFRPASRKTTRVGEKRKLSLIEIDLNVADSGDDDSTEVGSRRAGRLKLDLNCMAEDDDGDQTDRVSCWRPPHRSSEQTASPASSSSSRRPSMRDFDLNDKPSFFDAVGSKLDVSAITIMGARMAVERRDSLNDMRQAFLGSGRSIEPTTTMSSRPMLPYAHITYGYSGSMMNPEGFPYAMDSRGITGSAGPHGASSAASPFLTSVANAGPASTRSFLDLNSGLSTAESGNRDNAYSGLYNL